MWKACKDGLPIHGNYIVWVKSSNKLGGYVDTASFGDYICENEDIRPGDPLYVEGVDDGNMRGSGWHREEDTHGGPYDTVFVDLNAKVTHWMNFPDAPVSVLWLDKPVHSGGCI